MRTVTPLPPASSPQPQTPQINQEKLWTSLHIWDIDTDDIERIEEWRKGERLDPRDRVSAEQIVHSQLFQDWIISPSSTKLLVHGNFSGILMQISALSLFCVTLTKAFRARSHCLCLVWFCGCHLGGDESDSESGSSSDDDDEESGYIGLDDGEEVYSHRTQKKPIERMLRSLIAQLLCDYDFGPATALLPPGVDLSFIEEGSLACLRCLFDWLVRQLPGDVTLFCILDGIVFYEREEFEDPMLDALGDILSLTADDSIRAAVKVLVTSPWSTGTVRVAFEDEGSDDDEDGGPHPPKSLIIPLDSLPHSQLDPSDERMGRELGAVDDDPDGGQGSEDWGN